MVLAACVAAIALVAIGLWAARHEIAAARGFDKIVASSHVCFAVPLAVFGSQHFSAPQSMLPLVPRYMPWRIFWVYAVGCALIAASVSIAARIAVRWSGLLVGIMMFLFVAMIYVPGALARQERLIWTIVFRETSFGGAGLMLAAQAMGWPAPGRRVLATVGRICIAVAALVFGVQHFFHATLLPGVPLRKEMPTWIPGRVLIDYVTGAALVVAGGSMLLTRKTRAVATGVGSWLLLLVLVIYGPVLMVALSDPTTAVQVEGINYFADTLLFTGAILSAASALSPDPVRERQSAAYAQPQPLTEQP